jgi:hypothetical protein
MASNEIAIVITGDNRSRPAFDQVADTADRAVTEVVESVRAGVTAVLGALDRATAGLGGDFQDAGQAAGDALVEGIATNIRDLPSEVGRSGARAGSELMDSMAERVRAGSRDVQAAAERSVRGVSEAARDAGTKAGDFLKENMAAGAAAAGAAAGALLASSVTTALELGGAKAKLAAELGGDASWAAEAGGIVGDVYGRGVVESFDEAATAFKAVWRSGLLPEDATGGQLEALTAKVSALGVAFGEDVTPLAAAAGKMIKTGLVRDGAQALDILTKGMQSNANEAGDLSDTFIEYSTQFRKWGLTGEQALGMLGQAMRAGARDSDIAADAIKEFALQAMTPIEKLDSKGRLQLTEVGASFRAVGLDGYAAQKMIAAGGASAASALTKTLAGLRGIEDPIERAQVATALFGTQAEDLGDALYAMDPSTAVKSLGQVAGAADQVGKTLEESPAAALESFKRQVDNRLTEVGGRFIKFATEHSAVFGPLAAAIGGITLALLGTAAAVTVVNVAMAANPIVLIVAGIVAATVGLVAALLYVWNTQDGLRQAFSDTWNAASSAVTTAVSVIGTGLTAAGAWFAALPGLVGANIGRVPGIVGGFLTQTANTAAYLAGYGVGLVVREFVALPGRVVSGIMGIPGAVGGILSWTASVAGTGASRAVSWATRVFSGAPGRIGSALSSIPSRVQGAMAGAGSWLYRGGQAVVRGAIDGIRSMGSAAANAVSDMGSNMVSGFRDAIGWHSPALKFVEGGKAIVEGLHKGIVSSASRVTDAMGVVDYALGQSRRVMALVEGRTSTGGRFGDILAGGRRIMQTVEAQNARTRAASASSYFGTGLGGQNVSITIRFESGGGSLEDLIIQLLRKRIRVETGGNVQAALGRG